MSQEVSIRRQRSFDHFGSKMAHYGFGLTLKANPIDFSDLMDAAFEAFSDPTISDSGFEEGCRLFLEIASQRRMEADLYFEPECAN